MIVFSFFLTSWYWSDVNRQVTVDLYVNKFSFRGYGAPTITQIPHGMTECCNVASQHLPANTY